MGALLAFLSDPRHQIRWWASWTVAWLVLTPLTLLTGLRTSVPWLEWMSLFANFASCGTALVAAWAYFRARNVDEQLDMAAHFARIEQAEERILAALDTAAARRPSPIRGTRLGHSGEHSPHRKDEP